MVALADLRGIFAINFRRVIPTLQQLVDQQRLTGTTAGYRFWSRLFGRG